MQTSKQVRRKPTKTASSRQHRTNARSVARSKTIVLEHGRDLKTGRRIGPLLMPGLAGFYDWPDSALLHFVAQVIADNYSGVSEDTQLTPADLALMECEIIARAIIKTPKPWQVFRFPLPGLAAHRYMTIEQTLRYLATRWHEHQAEWKRVFVLPIDGEFEWPQVTIVCETFLCREGVLEKIPYEGPAHRLAFKKYGNALRVTLEHPNLRALREERCA